jgi:hypothetical protein
MASQFVSKSIGSICSTARTSPLLLCEHGVGRICTRETDFNQFPFS